MLALGVNPFLESMYSFPLEHQTPGMKYYVVRDMKQEVAGVLKHDAPIFTLRLNQITKVEFDTYLEFGIKLMSVGDLNQMIDGELTPLADAFIQNAGLHRRR